MVGGACPYGDTLVPQARQEFAAANGPTMTICVMILQEALTESGFGFHFIYEAADFLDAYFDGVARLHRAYSAGSTRAYDIAGIKGHYMGHEADKLVHSEDQI